MWNGWDGWMMVIKVIICRVMNVDLSYVCVFLSGVNSENPSSSTVKSPSRSLLLKPLLGGPAVLRPNTQMRLGESTRADLDSALPNFVQHQHQHQFRVLLLVHQQVAEV